MIRLHRTIYFENDVSVVGVDLDSIPVPIYSFQLSFLLTAFLLFPLQSIANHPTLFIHSASQSYSFSSPPIYQFIFFIGVFLLLKRIIDSISWFLSRDILLLLWFEFYFLFIYLNICFQWMIGYGNEINMFEEYRKEKT